MRDLLDGVLRAGVEHQSVEPVECADSVADDAAAALLVAQIARQQRQAASLAVEQRAERSGIGLFGRQIVDGDVGPFAGESDGDGTADSRVAARDERLAPQQPPVSAIALFAGVGTGLHPAFESRRLLLLGGVGVVVVLPARVDEDIVAIVRHDVKRCGGRRCPAS